MGPEAAAGGGGLPPLSLSAGPSNATANSGGGALGSGAFNFKPKGNTLQSLLPLVALVGVAWIITRKK